MKFDIILTNPPFNLGEKMLIKWFDIADEICTVQPSTWLLGKKQKKDIVKNVDACEKTEIESIQGSKHFDAAISGEIAIQHFIKGKENNRKENNRKENNSHYDKQIIFDGKQYNKCEEITKFSNDELLIEFKNIVEPLYLKDNLKNHLKYIVGLTGHVLHKSFHEDKSPNENSWCVRVISFSPGKGSDGFYTLISKNGLNDYGQYKDMKNKTIIFGGKKKKFMEYYYTFNNKQDCINFINYIQTDFCRVCLYLVKTNMHIIANGATKNIPWFDFSDPVFSKSPTEIDDYLFAKYNISDEIRKHIEELLPDYYKIRNISYE